MSPVDCRTNFYNIAMRELLEHAVSLQLIGSRLTRVAESSSSLTCRKIDSIRKYISMITNTALRIYLCCTIKSENSLYGCVYDNDIATSLHIRADMRKKRLVEKTLA